MDSPTPNHQDSPTPDGYSFATEIALEKATEIASAAAKMSAGDIIDFQSGLSNQKVKEVELMVGEGGSPISNEDSVRTVRVQLESYTDNAENPIVGEDAITLYLDCWQADHIQNTATIVRDNYNTLHSFTYGDVLAIEQADNNNEGDFIIDWELIPECINTAYAHPKARYDMSHGEATREKAEDDFFEHWAETVNEKTILKSHYYVDKNSQLSTASPIMLVPILYKDGIIKLQNINIDQPFGYLDISQTFSTMHDTVDEQVDFELREEFLDDMRYPFGITIKNSQHL